MIQTIRRGLRWVGHQAIRLVRNGWMAPVMAVGTLLMTTPALAASLPHTMLVASGSGIPQVNFGNANTQLGNKINTGLETIAATLRDILGATALVVIIAAAVMNHYVINPRAKEVAKELIGAAVVGLLLAAFAPDIVNFFTGL